MMISQRTRLLARASLLLGLGVFAIPACSTLEAAEEGTEFSVEDSSQAPEPDGADPSKKQDTPKAGDSEQESSKAKSKEPTQSAQEPTESAQEPTESAQERNCDDIAWGEELREGETVILGATKGYLDTDGDNKVERKETDVGMCQLHRTGKKCGMVFYARKT